MHARKVGMAPVKERQISTVKLPGALPPIH
jgi:hypothetical protein